MDSSQLADALVRTDILSNMLVRTPDYSITMDEGLKKMDLFLYEQTKQLFGGDSEGAFSFFSKIVELAEEIFDEQKLWDSDVESLLNQAKRNFKANYATNALATKNLNPKLLDVDVKTIGNRFQDRFVEIFDISPNISNNWPKIRGYTVMAVVLGLWFLFLMMITDYATVLNSEASNPELVKRAEMLLMAGASQVAVKATLFSVSAGTAWWEQATSRVADIVAVRAVSAALGNNMNALIFGIAFVKIMLLIQDIIVPYFTERPQRPMERRRSPRRRIPKQKCNVCGIDAALRCSKCKQAFYCTAQCQTAHWKEHSSACQQK